MKILSVDDKAENAEGAAQAKLGATETSLLSSLEA